MLNVVNWLFWAGGRGGSSGIIAWGRNLKAFHRKTYLLSFLSFFLFMFHINAIPYDVFLFIIKKMFFYCKSSSLGMEC